MASLDPTAQSRSPFTAAAQEQDETRRHAWFAAAETGDVGTMAALLTQQPALIDATTRLQVRLIFYLFAGVRSAKIGAFIDAIALFSS